jgi:hypothetical protein
MGFNPFARHAQNQHSKPDDHDRGATCRASISTTETEPQTTAAGNAAETEERSPARAIEKKPAPAARTGKAVNPFASHAGKKQFRLIRKEEPPPAQKLLNWLQHDWPHPIVHLRDLCIYGPTHLRNRKKAIELAEILVGHGWLVPIEASCVRRDTKWWRIIRGPSGYPTTTNVAVNVAPNATINVATEGG